MLLVYKKKIGGNHALSEIIKLQFWKKMPYIALYFTAFQNNCCLIISKKCVVTPIFFLDSNNPCWDLLFPHSHKPRRNTSVLVGTVFNLGKSSGNFGSFVEFVGEFFSVFSA